MPTDAPLAPSGIGPVEVVWGGLARPGAYLLVGGARQGRLHLAAQAAGGAVAAGERVLVFSGRETEAVTGLAREADVDLADAYRRGLARLLRVPAAKDLAALGEAGLARAMADMAAAAKGTARVVIEDFTPFVQFRSFDAFSTAFRRLVSDVAAHGATLVLGLGEPANDGSRRLLDFVQGEVTGTLHVRPDAGGYLLTLTPGRGHAGQGHTAAWSPGGAPPTPPPALFTEAPLFAEAPLAPDAPAPAAVPADLPTEIEGPDAYFSEGSSDGYAGATSAELDAGALVVSALPPEPFGPMAGPADPTAMGLSSPASAVARPAEAPEPPAADPFAGEAFAEDPFADDPFATDPFPAAAEAPEEAPELAVPDAFAGDAPASDGAAWDVEGASLMPVELPPPAAVALPPGLDPMGVGYLVDSDVAGVAPDAQAPQWAAETAMEGGDMAPALGAMPAAPVVAPPAMAPQAAAPTNDEESPEAAFRDDLAAAFAERGRTPFLVLAVRIDTASGYATTFPAVADGLLAGLTADDRALVRDDDARLVALLPNAAADTPQRLLGAVHAHLTGLMGPEAEHALRAVGVLPLPDGQPFATPDELLAYALG